MQATALAHPNIALIKYWGKRDTALNLPAVGSLSITLDTLHTRTRLRFDPALEADDIRLDGEPAGPNRARRVSACLDRLRARAGVPAGAVVDSRNNFPTGAGLASSASGFAALVVAADRALGLGLSAAELSEQARLGSGSAARSIFGGFVDMTHGTRADGSDAIARPLLTARDWPLSMVIAVTSEAAKAVGSTDGMTRTRETSPYYRAWVETAETDLSEARRAIETRDFDALASVSEYSCLKMHGLALAARPGLLYWNPATVACLQHIHALRAGGTPVFFTMDAGPQVKALCPPEQAETVARALADEPGVLRVLRTGLGEGARLVAESEAA
jgi:diphosphomevalonate decarboxylase